MIINPWFFYLLQIAGSIRPAAIIAAVLCVFVGIGCVIYNSEYTPHVRVKPWFVGAIVLIAMCPFIPSKDTLLLMKASEFVTYDNVNLTVDTLKSAIDYAAALF